MIICVHTFLKRKIIRENSNYIYMRKHWFLIVMLALITFTSCKKENMIVGNWELIEGEGINDVGLFPKGYIFDEYGYCALRDGSKFEGGYDNEIFYCGRYNIYKNTLTLESSGSFNSMKISFLGARKMIWKSEKDGKIKYTFKKVTEFSDNGKYEYKIDYDSILSNDQIIITTVPKKSVTFYMEGTGQALIDMGNGRIGLSNNLLPTNDMRYEYSFFPDESACNIKITGNVTYLDCKGSLAKLDVSNNTALTKLVCEGYLTELDVSKNTALTYLVYNHSGKRFEGLTSLDLSNNTALAYIDCSYNLLTVSAMNALFESLHNNPIQGGKSIHISLCYETKDCDISIAEKKGWKVHVSYI